MNSPSMRPGGYWDYRLSIVVPLFNEEEVVVEFHKRLSAVVTDMQEPAEILYVDDGSSDGTAGLLRNLQQRHPNLSVVRFSRNFGKELALTAGLRMARGEGVVILDADLQHPPESIPAMVQAWRDGAEVVNMRRRHRHDESRPRRWAAGLFYRVMNHLSETPIPRDVGDFRLFGRAAVNALNDLPERNRFMKGLFAWIGFRQTTLEYECAPRHAGFSKWRMRDLLRFALEGVTAFSVMPLRIASKLGFLCASLSILYSMYFLIGTLLHGDKVPGFPTLIVVVLMLGGLQLMAIGILGEYLGRVSIESKQRPLYLVESYLPARKVSSHHHVTDVLRG